MLNEEDLSVHLSLCSIKRICEQRPINFSFSELNSHQVQSALGNLKVNKAAGWDSTCIRTQASGQRTGKMVNGALYPKKTTGWLKETTAKSHF